MRLLRRRLPLRPPPAAWSVPRVNTASFHTSAARHRLHAGRLLTVHRHIQRINNPPELVIFDKDGTLVCFHSMWTPWIRELVANFERSTGRSFENSIYSLLGFDQETNKFVSGSILAEDTHAVCTRALEQLLVTAHGYSGAEAADLVRRHWVGGVTVEGDTLTNVAPIGHVLLLFKILTKFGVKIAVCTSDNREGSTQALQDMGLLHDIDAMICGDDKFSVAKPAPDNAQYLCKLFKCPPERVVVVGDTPADTRMGRAANLGTVIGVTSGVCGREHLEEDADYVVDDIHDILDIVLPGRLHTDDLSRQTSLKDANSIAASRDKLYESSRRASRSVKLDSSPESPGISPSNQPRRGLHSVAGHTTLPTRSLSALSKPIIGVGGVKLDVEDLTWKHEADYVIVGAGSAGCVLANRLTEDSSNSVLLLEAGPRDYSWTIHMPVALMYNLGGDSKFNWNFYSEPQPELNNRRIYCPRGKGWGGSSSINGMVYIRGHALDYDRWADETGDPSWGYRAVLPYFQRAQSHELGRDDYRGGSGPLKVTRGRSKNPLHDAWIEAGRQAGFPVTPDVNGYQQEGVGYVDMTVSHGVRWSTANAYLRPALSRSNLRTMTKVATQRVLFEKGRAVGVLGWRDKQLVKIRAHKEVILSAGSIGSPHILMLSGVGDKSHLGQHGIHCLQHLPGVGSNLQDHLEVYVQHKCKEPVSLYGVQRYPKKLLAGVRWFLAQSGPCATNHMESGGFVRTDTSEPHPNVQWHFLPSLVVDHGRVAPPYESFQAHVGTLRGKSRGSLRLASADPAAAPVIDPRYFTHPRDVQEFVQAVRITREVFRQAAFDRYRGEEILPGPAVQSDSELEQFVRSHADTAYHHSCTCKMGPASDPSAVVDPSGGRVHGVDALRVVDSSIFPSLVSGNLNAATIMLAEKISDHVKGESPLPPLNHTKVYQPPTHTIYSGSLK